MYRYYINLTKDIHGRNEIHKESCSYLKIAKDKAYIGIFNNAIEAVSYAKKLGYHSADGCYYCSLEAHRG